MSKVSSKMYVHNNGLQRFVFPRLQRLMKMVYTKGRDVSLSIIRMNVQAHRLYNLLSATIFTSEAQLPPSEHNTIFRKIFVENGILILCLEGL